MAERGLVTLPLLVLGSSAHSWPTFCLRTPLCRQASCATTLPDNDVAQATVGRNSHWSLLAPVRDISANLLVAKTPHDRMRASRETKFRAHPARITVNWSVLAQTIGMFSMRARGSATSRIG